MKTCQTYQEHINLLAGGNEEATTSAADIQSLMGHATVCPNCSNHAINTLVIVNGTSGDTSPPSEDLENRLFSELDRIEAKSHWPWLKIAAVFAVAISTFAMGRWSTPPPEPVVKEIVIQEPRQQEQLPSIAIDRHEYGNGFLAGRSFVIHKNN
ncbi:MAG: hypothetical protein ACI97A_003677 [Planctomycetota bacterium]|jgi:hypothetical protein